MELPKKTDVQELPKNTTAEAIITKVEVKTWREIIPEDKLEKFSEPDEKRIIISCEGKGFKHTENYKYEEKPSCRSKLGKFLLRYDEIKVSSQIQINFAHESNSSILI